MPDQQNWRSCNKCGSIFYGGLGDGRCAAGGPHDSQGGWYVMPTAKPVDASSQGNWRWCSKCQVLFFPGGGASSCPAGGGHDGAQSGEYFIATTMYAGGAVPQQFGWYWCGKCQGLHAGAGVCSAGGGHSQTGSGEYVMKKWVPRASDVPPAEQQSWRWCHKCQATFYGTPGTGHCAAGGPHDSQNGSWYAMPTARLVGINNQGGWHWCSKCQVLFFPGGGAGSCPAGGGHDATGSAEYFVATSTYPSHGQEGWRWCSKCQGLNFSGDGAGVCSAGGGHEQRGSSHYSMKLSANGAVLDVWAQPYIEMQCKLIVDYDPNQNRKHRYQVVLTPRDGKGAAISRAQITLFANAGVDVDHEENGVVTRALVGPATPLVLTSSAMGRCRITIDPGPNLTVPLLKAQWSAMPADQWAVFSPDSDLHAQLAGVTANQIRTTPKGKTSPLMVPPWVGQRIVLSSWQNNRLESLDSGGLRSQPNKLLNEPPVWTVVDEGNGTVSLRNAANKSLACDQTGNVHVTSNRDASTRWFIDPTTKKFETIYLRSELTGRRLGANQDGVIYSDPEGKELQRWSVKEATWDYSLGAHRGAYDWNHLWKFPNDGRGLLCFHVVTNGSIFIAISPEAKTVAPMYEIVLSSRVNSIKRSADGTTGGSTYYSLGLQAGMDVWILLDKTTGVISVGEGSFTIGKSPFLTFTDPDYLATARYITFRSGEEPVTLSAITVRERPTPAVPSQLSDADALAKVVTQVMRPCMDHRIARTGGALSFSDDDASTRALSPLAPAQQGTETRSGAIPPVYQIAPQTLLQRPFAIRATPAAPATGAVEPLAFWSPWGWIYDNVIDPAVSKAQSIGGIVVDTGRYADKVASVIPTLVQTISNESMAVFGTTTQYLDTVGPAAQFMIRHADVAELRAVEHFAEHSIATAHQLAIDASNGLVILALVVEDGVSNLVKTVIDTVESAALITAAFFRRVGLEVWAVIEFLASLFDWDDILQTQTEIQQALDKTFASFDTVVQAQRPKMAERFRLLESVLAGLTPGTAGQAPASPAAPFDVAGLGGPFGYLLDKVESCLMSRLSLPALNPGALATLRSSFSGAASQLADFAAAFQSSPFFTALADPSRLLNQAATSTLELVTPLVTPALKLVAVLLDAALAGVPFLMSAVRTVFQQRIAIPFLTDFIERLVFRGRQKLSLESLLTLMAAALVTVLKKLAPLATGGALSFADEMQGGVSMGLTALAALLNLFQVGISAYALYLEAHGTPKEALKGYSTTNTYLGFFGAVVTVPFTMGNPYNSYMNAEQWINWFLNFVASDVQVVAGTASEDEKFERNCKILSTVCGVGMIASAGAFNGLVLNGHGDNPRSDRTLVAIDLAAQITSGVNNGLVWFSEPACFLAGFVTNTGSCGLGIANVAFSALHSDAALDP